MTTSSYHVFSQEAHRLQAVMALFKGEKTSQVSTTFGICRSDLSKFRKRAWVAMRGALKDHPRGPKRAHNRLDANQEQKVMALCQRHPALGTPSLYSWDGNQSGVSPRR